MRYVVSNDFTKLSETSGTIQNVGNVYPIEVSDKAEPNSGILLYPLNKISFANKTLYIRCVDGAGAEVVVVPFEVDAGGGGGSSGGGASYAIFTGATSGISGLSGFVPAPHPGDESKFLRGDGTWSGELILPTVANSVDGGFWLDVTGDTPVPKFCFGGISYALGTIVTPSTTDFSEFLVAYLPLDTATTTDICGNSWAISGGVSIDNSIKKFGAGSFLSSGGYIAASDIFDVTGDKWSFDCWIFASSVPDSSVWCHLGSNNGSVYTGVWFGQHQAVIGPLLNGDWQYRTGDIFANTLNQWEHVAMVKDGSRLYFFSNGQLVERGTLPQTISGGSHFRLGHPALHITEARFFDGVARWTSDFTPPTAADYS